MANRSDANAWARLLDRLSEDRASLVDDFLARLAQLGLYDEHDVTHEDLHQAASDTLEMLILQLAGVPLPSHLRDLPARLGVRRARQGVARDHLLEAVRLDFKVLWAGLVRAMRDESADLLVRHAEEVLSTVERYIGDVQVAFLDEQAALARDSRIETSRAFSRLLAAGEDVAVVAINVAERLRFRVDASFEVVSVAASEAERARRAIAAGHGRHFVSWDLDDGTAFVRERRADAGWSAVLGGIPGGLVDDVAGLAAVPAAIELARTIGRHASEDVAGLSTEADVWLSIAQERLRPVLPGLGPSALAGLDRLSAGDRERVIETVLWYCANGSIKETATTLYCHRNTVVNRLALFREVTGLDVTIPVEAARALIMIGTGTRRTA